MTIAEQIKTAVSAAFSELRAALVKPNPESSSPAPAPAGESVSHADLTDQVRAEIKSAVDAAVAPLQTELTQAKADLATANESIANLQAEARAKDAKIATLEATIADPKGKIETVASTKAAEIAAAQGVPALPANPPVNPAASVAPSAKVLKGRARLEAAINAQLNPKP